MHTCEIRHSLLCGFGWESGWEMIGEPATLRSRCFAHATAKIGRTPQAYEQPSCSPCCSLPSTSVGPPVPAIETKLPSSAYPHSSCIRMQRSARQVKPLRKNMRRELRPSTYSMRVSIIFVTQLQPTRLATRCEASGQLPPIDHVKTAPALTALIPFICLAHPLRTWL